MSNIDSVTLFFKADHSYQNYQYKFLVPEEYFDYYVLGFGSNIYDLTPVEEQNPDWSVGIQFYIFERLEDI